MKSMHIYLPVEAEFVNVAFEMTAWRLKVCLSSGVAEAVSSSFCIKGG